MSVASLGCGRSPVPEPPVSKPCCDASPLASSARPAPAERALAAGISLERCYRDAPLLSGSDELARDVAARCAAGMLPLAGPVEGSELSFQVVAPTGCIRAVAVGDAVARERTLTLRGEGQLWSVRAQSTRIALLPEDAVLCLDRPGTYRLQSDAKVRLGVWQAR